MATRNQVTLTFDGDSKGLESTFDRVGAGSKDMSQQVDRSAKSMRDAGAGFDRAGEAADSFDTKSMGARDGITGVQDSMLGFAAIARGEGLEGALLLGSGFSDIGSSLYNFVIPSLKSMTKATITNGIQTVKTTAAVAANRAATVGQGIATVASTVATKAMTAAQRVLNLVMRANPIGLIITLLFAAGAAFVALWRRSETFRNVVTGALNGVKNAASAVWGAITAGASRLGGVFRGIGRAISAPFRGAFQGIKNAWNNTVGGRGFSVPGWVPGIGGREFRIPTLHTGGIMPGVPGSQGLAMLRAGERVSPASRSGGAMALEIRGDGSRLAELLIDLLREAVRKRGGDVQLVLGRL